MSIASEYDQGPGDFQGRNPKEDSDRPDYALRGTRRMNSAMRRSGARTNSVKNITAQRIVKTYAYFLFVWAAFLFLWYAQSWDGSRFSGPVAGRFVPLIFMAIFIHIFFIAMAGAGLLNRTPFGRMATVLVCASNLFLFYLFGTLIGALYARAFDPAMADLSSGSRLLGYAAAVIITVALFLSMAGIYLFGVNESVKQLFKPKEKP